ncbi:ATP-binding protein [Actinophytocola oryzae]|uniref:Histidine kinase/DNA gyrase B/HSP90-like ATPase n=1 Tax=Actinophytocola oryzae TaxID=502181 RepID=A0A4R7US58_9PSEU|nr:ATP-binding protein [Actinophytocola oryzae]TDV36687.1 histidine kinase/DNA gyrase B/HSP90-like ATPase [Actinophytocola oryzae]
MPNDLISHAENPAASADTPKPIPAMLTGRALQSLRESGYTLAAALGEVIDNSLEANANQIKIDLREVQRGKRKAIDRIVVADDGDGMSDNVLHHYLQLGFSTRYMSETTIGKFGVGAKLAALNFSTRIDVWTKTRTSDTVRHVWFDLAEALNTEDNGLDVTIAPPDDKPLPVDLVPLFPQKSGTLVAWSNIDRLADGSGPHTPGNLRQEIEKELARIFREFLYGGIELRVNDRMLLPHDPTFVRERTWADKVLADEYARRATDKTSVPEHFAPTRVYFNDMIRVDDHEVGLVITLAPREAVRRRGLGGDELAKKLRLPDNQGQISFMRLGREISYTNVPRIFPKGVEDPDRFIGVEVHFSPALDRMMGVRNVKRGAEPSDDFRSALREKLVQWIPVARQEIQDIWGEADRRGGIAAGEHDDINQAVAQVNTKLPKTRVAPPGDDSDATSVDELLELLASDTGRNTEEEKRDYVEKTKKLPVVIESVDLPGTGLFDIIHTHEISIVRLNTRHRFYRQMYQPLRALSKGESVSAKDGTAAARRAVEALTLLIVAYARAETMCDDPNESYGELRQWWGSFTDKFLAKIKDVID